MIPVFVADLPQMSQRRVQVVPELQPLIGWLRDQPVKRAEISRFQRRECLLVGPAIDRPDAHRAADVVIPYRYAWGDDNEEMYHEVAFQVTSDNGVVSAWTSWENSPVVSFHL